MPTCLIRTRTVELAKRLLMVASLAAAPGSMARAQAVSTGSGAKAPTRASAQAPAKKATSTRLLGTWRVSVGAVAPWVRESEPQPNRRELIGATVTFAPTAVSGAPSMACTNARYESTNMPAEGLFQGGLPTPATANAARALGFKALPVAGVSLTCDRGIFEYHVADAQSILVALDNVIWTLNRSAGTRAAAGRPEHAVQRLLERHFAGEMAFTPASIASKDSLLSPALRARIAAYFAKPTSPDEAPIIDGDAFTNTQEYPTRFAVGSASGNAQRATVPVRFSDGYMERTVTYVMRRSTIWQVDDLRYEDGSTLRASLK